MNYWILQSNPNTYCMDYIRRQKDESDIWAISRYVDEIEKGDIAFIWLSNEYRNGKLVKPRGIYAVARITELPDLQRQFESNDPYWIDKEEQKRLSALPKLELRYDESMLSRPLLVDDLKAANLGNLLILRMARWSIYKLAAQEGEAIKRLIDNR